MRVLAVISILCVISISLGARDLMVGEVGPDDVILFQETEYWEGVYAFQTKRYIRYPKLKRDENATITAIFIKDNKKDGTGGYPRILEGGVGYKYVRIQIRNLKNLGYNSTITIYGRY